jgi:hypothetical protein
MPKSIAPFLT